MQIADRPVRIDDGGPTELTNVLFWQAGSLSGDRTKTPRPDLWTDDVGPTDTAQVHGPVALLCRIDEQWKWNAVSSFERRGVGDIAHPYGHHLRAARCELVVTIAQLHDHVAIEGSAVVPEPNDDSGAVAP